MFGMYFVLFLGMALDSNILKNLVTLPRVRISKLLQIAANLQGGQYNELREAWVCGKLEAWQ